jgi:hypothetical protein
VATACGVASDDALVHFGDALQQDQQFVNFFSTLVCVHSYAHDYVGGTINPSQTSARDPFFYMMHANVDRLWASWQSHASYRLDTASAGLQTGIYGVGLISPYSEQMENLTFHFEPWADEQATAGMPMYRHIRPYTTHCNPSCPAGEGPEPAKDSTAVDIVTPPLYDALLP